MDETTKNDVEMTAQEAGKLGGEETKKTYDKGFYEDIAREGGKASDGSLAKGDGREKDQNRQDND